MAKQFLYACALLSSILVVSVSAFEPSLFVAHTIQSSIQYVEMGDPNGGKLYIEAQIASLTTLQKTSVLDSTKHIVFHTTYPKDKIVAYYMLNNLKPDLYTIQPALNWIRLQISLIDLHDQSRWKEFVIEIYKGL
uniref:uncharacterized protein LOC120346042 n=1 Tax=Styela clava TaxID=7725 RepID=UPI00193A63BE|nr:uncharacterized protein LOC120346042 [Styela clava]